jgi:hypothetical protein
MNGISSKSWRAGASLIAGLLLVTAPYRASGQAAPLEIASNIECLERLEIPDYPPVPRQARIQGMQTIKVLLSERGTAQIVESTLHDNSGAIQLRKKDFTESAEKAIKNSGFSKTCGGRIITLVFHYELRDDESKSLFAFGPPNHFWIRGGPFYVMP